MKPIPTGEDLAPFRLDGEVALITGGGSGLGRAIARCIASAGGRVVLAGRRAERLQETARARGERAA